MKPNKPAPDTPQALIGYLSNDEWDELLADVTTRLQALDQLPDDAIKQQVFALLQGIDTIHREGLHRLVRLFKEGVLEQVVTDPAIHTLMELYDLLPGDLVPDQDAKPDRKAVFPPIPIKVVPAASTPKTSNTRPHWIPVLQSSDELAIGEIRVVFVDDRDIVVCRADDGIYALDAHCAQDGASLAPATLKNYTLICPQHTGCLYDIRQGTRIASADRLTCYPVRIADDHRIMVGLGVPFQPRLPSF